MPKVSIPESFHRYHAEQEAKRQFSDDELHNLLSAIITLEHQTDKPIGHEQYAAMFKLACMIDDIPVWIRHYFGRKATEAAERAEMH